MISYPVSLPQLKVDVEAFTPNWLARAADLTEQARAQGSFKDIATIWSEIKPVFMRLQGDYKCAYCERKLEAEEYGAIEQDVEHFRPKNRVSAWPPSQSLKDAGLKLAPAPKKEDGGYYLLAHQILNYAAGCKPCNSTLKADRFPVAKAHVLDGDDPRTLKTKEKPLLIFPIGDWGDDAEKLMAFRGVAPHAVVKSGFARLRALATIEFFALDDVAGRKNLFRERAQIIALMFPQMEIAATPGGPAARVARAQKVITAAIASTAPHANCARSFKRLFEDSPGEAEQIFDAAADFVASIS